MATNLPSTPLALLLESEAARAGSPVAPLAAYCGVLSPRVLDASEREMAALVAGAGVHDLGWLRRLAVRGEDRFRWLNGMVTNTVIGLGANAGAWNLALNAQGRIQGDLYVWREGSGSRGPHGQVFVRGVQSENDTLELEIAAGQMEKLLAHLDRFIVMDDVELVRLTGETALGLTGPLAGELLGRLGLPALPEALTSARAEWKGLALRIVRSYGVLAERYELWVDAAEIAALWKGLIEAGATPVGTASLEALRIAEGIPAYGVDMVEQDLPQETSQLRALHYTKGCYLGQEIVERVRARGSVRRRLQRLEFDGPLPAAGTELKFQNAAGVEAAAGEITSATELSLAEGNRRFGLGMIREEAEVRSQPFTYTAGAATGTARILTAAPDLDGAPQMSRF